MTQIESDIHTHREVWTFHTISPLQSLSGALTILCTLKFLKHDIASFRLILYEEIHRHALRVSLNIYSSHWLIITAYANVECVQQTGINIYVNYFLTSFNHKCIERRKRTLCEHVCNANFQMRIPIIENMPLSFIKS